MNRYYEYSERPSLADIKREQDRFNEPVHKVAATLTLLAMGSLLGLAFYLSLQ